MALPVAIVALGLASAGSVGASARSNVAGEISDLKFIIHEEDTAGKELERGEFGEASDSLHDARKGLQRLQYDSGLTGTIQDRLNTAHVDDQAIRNRISDGDGPAQKAHLLDLLAEARAAKDAALTDLQDATLFPVTETVPFVPTDAAATLEEVPIEFQITAPAVYRPESVVADLGTTAVHSVVGAFVHEAGAKVVVRLELAVLFVGRQQPASFKVTISSSSTVKPVQVGAIKPVSRPISGSRALGTACSKLTAKAGETLTLLDASTLKHSATAGNPLQNACAALGTYLARPTPAVTFTCNGQIQRIFTSFTVGAARNGGAAPTFSTGGKAYCLTSIQTYHWNGGKGKSPGRLGLTHLSGPAGFSSVAATAAVGSAGQNNAPNVNWQANFPTTPKPTVIDGTYKCLDSDPATWSGDTAGSPAFCSVWAIPASH